MPRSSRQIHALVPVAIIFAAAVLSACEGETLDLDVGASDTACASGEAKILVLDGIQRRLCGCAEGEAYVTGPSTLSCTVAAGTRVFFEYSGSLGTHQMIPTGTPAIDPSPISMRRDGVRAVVAHTFVLSSSGTYSYVDAFNGSMTGQFLVP